MHIDIDYYYRLYSSYSPKPKKVLWEIEIYKRNWLKGFDDTWDHHQKMKYFNARSKRIISDVTIKDFKLIQSRQGIEALLRLYT